MFANTNYCRYVNETEFKFNMNEGLEGLAKEIEKGQEIADGDFGHPHAMTYVFCRETVNPQTRQKVQKQVAKVTVPYVPAAYGRLDDESRRRTFVQQGTGRVAIALKNATDEVDLRQTRDYYKYVKLIYIMNTLKAYAHNSGSALDIKAVEEFFKDVVIDAPSSSKFTWDVKDILKMLEEYQKTPARRLDKNDKNLIVEDGKFADTKRLFKGKMLELLLDNEYNNPITDDLVYTTQMQ